MAYFWILFILPLIAAEQRTTVNFPSNSGSSSVQQTQSNGGQPNGGQPNVGNNGQDSYYRVPNPALPERSSMTGQPNVDVSVAQSFANPNTMGYYRNPVVSGTYGPPEPQGFQPVGPGAVFPQAAAEVPNFYFNAGFNKGNHLQRMFFSDYITFILN